MIPLKDTIRSRHFPLMNWLLLGLNAFVFILQLNLGPRILDQFVDTFALIPTRLYEAPIWFGITLFTSMFMHAGWFHFLSNMWILFIFGDNVEDRMGPLGYLGFYLFSGAIAGILQTFVTSGSLVPVLGASGAIAGVLGAYLLLYPTARVVTLIPIFIFPWLVRIPAVFYLGFWFFVQLSAGVTSLGSGVVGGVAWWAHIGGFLFGLVMAPFFMWRHYPTRPKVAIQAPRRYSDEYNPYDL